MAFLVKLQRFASRRYKGKTYHKWVINPSSKDMEKLGWEPGDKLGATVRDGRLILRRVSEGGPQKPKKKQASSVSAKAEAGGAKAEGKARIRDLW